MPVGGRLHGFAGYFHATLYGEPVRPHTGASDPLVALCATPLNMASARASLVRSQGTAGEVHISTDPPTESVGMFSWFPLYIPLRHPVLVPDGGTVTVHLWRHASTQKVWYEWALHAPLDSPIHNPNGRSAYIGL